VTDGPLRIEPYVEYLWSKYGELYGLREEERAGAGAR
jgi:hypothetical protein